MIWRCVWLSWEVIFWCGVTCLEGQLFTVILRCDILWGYAGVKGEANLWRNVKLSSDLQLYDVLIQYKKLFCGILKRYISASYEVTFGYAVK